VRRPWAASRAVTNVSTALTIPGEEQVWRQDIENDAAASLESAGGFS